MVNSEYTWNKSEVQKPLDLLVFASTSMCRLRRSNRLHNAIPLFFENTVIYFLAKHVVAIITNILPNASIFPNSILGHKFH